MKKLLLVIITALIMGGLFAALLNESFTGTTFPPAGWTVHNVDGGQAWVRYTSTYKTPPAGASIRYDEEAHNDWLVTPRLAPSAANHTLSFWAYSTSYSYLETFKVWISTTGNAVSNFTTQLGPEVTAPNTWTQYQYDLTTYIGSEVYVAVQATGADLLRLVVDDFTGVDLCLFPEPSNHVTGFAATPGYTTVKLDWTGSTGTNLPTGYLIQAIRVGADSYAAVADGTPVADDSDWSDGNAAINVGHVVGANTYTFAGLTNNTAYEFKIWPYSNDGTDIDFKVDGTIPTVNATTQDPTIYPPWLENFGSTGTTFPPANWSRGAGMLADPTIITTGDYWVQDNWLNDTSVSPVNWAARMNVYGTNRGGWLFTPPIQMPGTGYQLELDIGLTDYAAYAPPDAPTDDRFIILIGDGSSWTPANIVREWNNTGSTYVYDNIPYTGEHVIIPIDSFTGIKYIAFYGESTVYGGDNDLFVDNVRICQTPASSVFTIAPELTSWDFGLLPVGVSAEKEFAVTNSGSGNLIVTSIIQTGSNPPFSIVPTPALPWSLTNTDPANTFKVVFTPQTAGGPFSTDVTVNYTNGTEDTYTISFTGSAYAPATLPLTEDWENGEGDWIFVNGYQANGWFVGPGDATYGPYAGDNFAYISNDDGTTVSYNMNSASVTHIYRDIAFDADCQEFPLSFQWRCRGEAAAWDRMRVYLVDTNVTPVAGTELTTGQVGLDNYNTQPAWTAETITLPGSLSGTVKRLVFSWRNDGSSGSNPPANIDNISLTAVPNPSGPVVAPNLDYPADRQTDLPKNGFSFQFSWNMAGSEPDTYNLYLANLADLDPGYSTDDFFAAATAYEDISSPYNPLFTYVYGETYVWTVSGSNASYPDPVFQWPPYEFTIEPDPTITNFPWDEDFEDGVFPPVGWTMVDVDGGGTYWVASTAYNHTTGGTTSARHSWNSSVPAPGQNGWLITPPAAIPNSTNNVVLSWWNYNQYPNDMVYNGVKVNTTNDPADPNWVELWSQDSAAAAWGNEVLNINAYKGQTVYFAFNYQGYNADSWHVDDVSIYEVAAALDAPVVSIALTAGQPTLSWDAVTGANSYLVYGATDPYAADPWTLLDTVYTPGYTYTGTAPMEFFKVVASDATAPGPVNGQATPAKNTPILNAPKGFFENGLRK